MQMPLKFLCCLSLCFLISIGSNFSQIQNKVAVPPVIPPSPDAAGLGKYGNCPVGLHTGIPDISIPLYTIQSGKLQVPISISYHAAGFKVNDIASWVGLGWSLNAGGSVSKSVVSLPDEIGFWQDSVKNSSQITTNDYTYLQPLADHTADGESDYYFYNFSGHSGKFVYKQNEPQTPFLIPQEPIEVKYVTGHFEIKDERGNVYKFAAIEDTYVSDLLQYFPGSYYLSEIISSDGTDHIQFTYVSDGSYSDTGASYTETIGQQCSQEGPPQDLYHTTNFVSTSRSVTPIRLKEIIYANGKVEFVRDLTRSDQPASRLGQINIFSRNSDGSYTARKSFAFGEDYFTTAPGGDPNKYRLKLTSLEEKDSQGVTIKTHQFFYNESVILPDHNSLAQDWWGYYNGQTTNTSLIANENITFLGYLYQVGNAIREPDATAMKACILNKIIYPTGGYTEFDYEPHSYSGGITKTPTNVSASSGQSGNTTDLLEQTVTFTPLTSGWGKVSTHCSNVTDAVPHFSSVSVRQQNATQYLLDHSYNPTTYSFFSTQPELTLDFMIYLTAGSTYELKVTSKGNSTSSQMNYAAFSQATVFWDERTSGTPQMAGGLRVKEIRDYPATGANPVTRIYNYKDGVLLIPPDGLSSSKQEIDFQFYQPGTNGSQSWCSSVCSGKKMIITGRPAYDLTTLNGAPVVYPEVEVYENSLTAPNGKEVHKFDVEEDQFTYADKAYNNGRFQLNDSWRGGDQVASEIFKGNTTTKVKETGNLYGIFLQQEGVGTKVGWKVQMEGCQPTSISESVLFSYLYYFDYPFYSGIKKLTSSNEISYSSSDSSKFVESGVQYHYDNLDPNHQQLSRKITFDSEGNNFETRYWYPADYNAVENIQTLLSNHVIGIPVKEENYRNNKILTGQVTRLNDFGNPKEVHTYDTDVPQPAPTHDKNVIVPASYIKRLDVAYNSLTQNIESLQRVNNTMTSYIWGYNNTMPIAEVKNAEIGAMSTNYSTTHYAGENITVNTSSDVALSPTFEVFSNQTITPTATVAIMGTNGPPSPYVTIILKRSDGTAMKTHNCSWGSNSIGNVTLTPGIYQWYYNAVVDAGNGFNGYDLDITTPYTGQRTGYKSFHTSFEENGVTNADARTGSKVWSGVYELNLPGYNGDYKLCYWQKTGTNPWVLTEQTVTVTAGAVQTMNIGAAGSVIDEVRLFPPGAVMTTYTYDPILGITSTTDANQITSYYEYDDLGQLQVIRDQDKNILKAYSYHYKQQ